MGPDTIYGTSQGPDSAISFWEKFKQNIQWEIVLIVWEKENSYILSQCVPKMIPLSQYVHTK